MAAACRLTIAHLHVADQRNKGDVAIVLAVQELWRRHFKNCRIIDIPIDVLKNGDALALKKINSADCAVIGGGGIFYSYFLPFDRNFIKKIKRPIIIFGVGYIREIGARALSREEKRSIIALVRAASLVGVRDERTKKFLTAEGVSRAQIQVIGDPAILLSEKKPVNFKLASGGLVSGRLVSGGGTQAKAYSRPPRLGLNLNYSGWLGFGKWRNEILEAYRAVAGYFQKEYGAEIYYLQHHPSEKKIYPELKIDNLYLVNLPPAEQKYIYGRLDLVVGMMLHVGVLAFGAGTPEISVAYDLRNYSFAEFIACPELVIDLDTLKQGELLRLAKIVFTNREKYVLLFKRRWLAIRRKQENFFKRIKSVL